MCHLDEKKQSRQSNFELLRILAMIMIVASHWGWWAVTYPGLLTSGSQQLFYTYFRTFGQVGVVLFILISGYFLCKRPFKLFSLLKLLAQVFFYICFLLIVYYVRGYLRDNTLPTLGISGFTDWFIPISTGRWWFLSCYTALYLLSPFLNKLLSHLKKNEFRILLIVLFFFVSVFPSFYVYTTANDAMQNMIIFIFIYLIGAYIRLYQGDFQNKGFCFIGAVLSFFIFIFGKKIGFEELRYYIHVIALSVFLFLTFLHIEIHSHWINSCSKTTFGIYLLHENTIITFWLWNDIFAIHKFANTPWFIPVSIASVLTTCVFCGGIDYLRGQYFEPIAIKCFQHKYIASWIAAADRAMPSTFLQAESCAGYDSKPMVFLLFLNIFYFLCKIMEVYLQRPVSYKLFLLACSIMAFAQLVKKSKIKGTIV